MRGRISERMSHHHAFSRRALKTIYRPRLIQRLEKSHGSLTMQHDVGGADDQATRRDPRTPEADVRAKIFVQNGISAKMWAFFRLTKVTSQI